MDHHLLRRDALIAGLLVLVLGVGWTVGDWPALSRLHLPDTDDVMRLQQVRDWIGGQRFADLSQHRLGASVPMHWSRIADLGPAGLILSLRPILGTHAAEIAAVVVWPPIMFAAALFLAARIGRRLGVSAETTAVVAALAYPTTTVFLPGRIDHHGLQVVLLLAATMAALRERGGVGPGIAIGFAAVVSLVVGLETAPLFGLLGIVVAIAWIAGRGGGMLAAIGASALAALLLARATFTPEAFDWPACDGFTHDAFRAAMAAAIGAVLLGVSGRFVTDIRGRAALAVMTGIAVIAAACVVSPRCLSPYGAVDPRLARLWLTRVGEAQPLFGADPANAIGYAGLLVVGIAATAWRWRAMRDARWSVPLALMIGSLAIACVQLRGAYPGAMLAAPGLAALIEAARRRGDVALAGAWLVSAGLLYPLAARALPHVGAAERSQGDCTSPAMIARLAALRPGTVLAPIDAGAYLIAATPHRLVAAPYHRNGAGNLAMFAAYAASPTRALSTMRAWRVDTVLACHGMSGGPGSMAAFLRVDRPPGMNLVYRAPDGAAIYAIKR